DVGRAIAVDAAGRAYLAGNSFGPDFPLRDPFQPRFGGAIDAWVAALDASGEDLLYSSYLGGSGTDVAFSIAVDVAGGAYVAGTAGAPNAFPLQNPWQATFTSLSAAFVARIGPPTR